VGRAKNIDEAGLLFSLEKSLEETRFPGGRKAKGLVRMG
jgi:hypothetical protein